MRREPTTARAHSTRRGWNDCAGVELWLWKEEQFLPYDRHALKRGYRHAKEMLFDALRRRVRFGWFNDVNESHVTTGFDIEPHLPWHGTTRGGALVGVGEVGGCVLRH